MCVIAAVEYIICTYMYNCICICDMRAFPRRRLFVFLSLKIVPFLYILRTKNYDLNYMKRTQPTKK